MRISDWSSDVCSSDLNACRYLTDRLHTVLLNRILSLLEYAQHEIMLFAAAGFLIGSLDDLLVDVIWLCRSLWRRVFIYRSEEHTSELQSLMRISYAVFCLKKKHSHR